MVSTNTIQLYMIIIAVSSIAFVKGDEESECSNKEFCSITSKPDTYDTLLGDLDKSLSLSRYWNPNNKLEDIDVIFGGDEENCRTVTRVEQPYILVANETRHFVVQTPLLTQKIRVTECLESGTTCFESVKPSGSSTIETSCKNKFGYTSLYIFNQETKQVEFKTFPIPVCCYCQIKNKIQLI